MYKKIWVLLILIPILVLMLLTVSQADEEKTPCHDPVLPVMEGQQLSPEDAAHLEEELRANPDELSARSRLLGYYFLRAYESKNARKARQNHILWIIRNRPDAEVAGLPYASLNPLIDEGVYSEAKTLWLQQIAANETNVAVLGNAANFFFLYDKDLAEDLLQRAQDLEPENPKWPRLLGHLYALDATVQAAASGKEAARKSLEQLEEAVSRTTEEIDRFYMLGELAEAAFRVDDMDKARTYATELLNLASLYEDDWNYGNAIHYGNQILGRIALKSGDVERAKSHLIESGKTPGSPQLNTFGPSMALAKELLEAGEKEAVVEYLNLCKTFWEMDDGRLDSWIASIKGGGMPYFGANLLH